MEISHVNCGNALLYMVRGGGGPKPLNKFDKPCFKILVVLPPCSLGSCDFAKEVHEGLMKCLSRCSCSDARDNDENSTASFQPCYMISLQYLSE